MSYNNIQPFQEDVYCRPFDVQIPRCITHIYIPVNNSDVDVMLVFTDKFGKEYLYGAHSDDSGLLLIDLTKFKIGLLNPYAGIFTVIAYFANGTRADRIYFNTDSGYYPQLNIVVVDTIYVNDAAFSNTLIDIAKFLCCCRTTPSCKNLLIDPCTGESLEPTPGGGSGGGGTGGGGTGGGNGCTPGFSTYINSNQTTLYSGDDIQYFGLIGGNIGNQINIAFDVLRNSCCTGPIVYRMYLDLGSGLQIFRTGTISPGSTTGVVSFTPNFFGLYDTAYIELQSSGCGTQTLETPIYVDCDPFRSFCYTTVEDSCMPVTLPIYSGPTPELAGGYYIPFDVFWPTIFIKAFPNACCEGIVFSYRWRLTRREKGTPDFQSISAIFNSVNGQIPNTIPAPGAMNPINLLITGGNFEPSHPLRPNNWVSYTLEIDIFNNTCNTFQTHSISFSIE